MPWTVYLLRCSDGTLYAGVTTDLQRRLAQHAAGKGARYTRGRGPLTVVHEEPARGRSTALRRELELKRLRRRDKLLLASAAVARTRRAAARGAP